MKLGRILIFFFLMFVLMLTACREQTPDLNGDTGNTTGDSLSTTPTEGVSYAVSDDGSCAQVLAYTGDATDVVIADTYNGLPVRRIGQKAFYQNERITSIVVPDSVSTIGESAFHSCSKLANIRLPEGVEIEAEAFTNCSLLFTQYGFCMYVRVNDNPHALLYKVLSKLFDNYEIHKNTKYIGYAAFSGCRSMKEITIPDGVAVIGNSAFKSCSDLSSVTIPDSVTAIGNNAFQSSGIGSVTIGKGVKTIGRWAFAFCDNLRSVTIPDNVSAIGDHSFGRCADLVSIDAGTDGIYYSVDGNLYTGTTLVQYPKGKSSTVFEIPDFVTAIGNHAFAGCSTLTSVTIPERVNAIGEGAFLECSKLGSVTIPEGVSSVGESAFECCSSLASIDAGTDGLYYSVDGNLYTGTTLVQYAIGKSALSFEIPDFVTVIGSYAFMVAPNLQTVTIPDGVNTIGTGAFYMCPALASVTIGNGVTTIGISAFSACKALTSVTMGSSVKNIGNAAFQNCYMLESITIPESVSYIGKYALTCGAETVIFENTEGWWISKDADAMSGMNLEAAELQNSSIASNYLYSKYREYYWKRG